MRVYMAVYQSEPDGDWWRLFFSTKREAEDRAEALRIEGHPCFVRSALVPTDTNRLVRWLNRIAYNIH